jgi:hypothetical protein
MRAELPTSDSLCRFCHDLWPWHFELIHSY